MAAEEAGLDPDPSFQRVAAASNDVTLRAFDFGPAAKVLREFRSAPVLAERRARR